MTPSIKSTVGLLVFAVFALSLPALIPVAAAGNSPVLLAAKDAAPPQKPSLMYEENMQAAMDAVIQAIKEIEAQKDLSIEEKQQQAMDFVRNYRWGMDGNNYFWVNDLQGRMLMHPINQQLEGNIVTGLRDAEGKLIFVEFIAVCLELGGGFVNYLWPDPTGEAPVPKTSLVRLFEPFGWVVGTGLYMETIEAYEEPIEPDFVVPLQESIDLDDRNLSSPT